MTVDLQTGKYDSPQVALAALQRDLKMITQQMKAGAEAPAPNAQ
jgi:hypothetical protein